MSDRIETIILSNLINDEEFCRKTLPFLKPEYFSERSDKVIFSDIESFFHKYNKLPTQQILKIHLDDRTDMKQSEFDKAVELVDTLVVKEPNASWLLERTEKFCKDQALYGAVLESISILDGKDTKYTKEAIPGLLQDALGISFDNSVGHDFFVDAERRYDQYHTKEDKLPFGLDIFNRITSGGLPKKTLSIVLASVNAGKSLFMCDCAAKALQQGKNVLFISLEMAEEKIAERVDCNLLEINIGDLPKVRKKDFIEGIQELKNKSYGKLVVKEYPTGGAHAGHFKSLIDELKTKKNFVPDFIIIDYLNICASQRIKNGNSNSYSICKSISEEFRGLAVEYNVPVLTASQLTRSGMTSTDVQMTDVSESIGIVATCDFAINLMRTPELDEIGQVLIKQLKSRLGSVSYYTRFVVGINLDQFKLYDVDQPGANLSDAGKTDDSPKGYVSSKTINVDGLDFT